MRSFEHFCRESRSDIGFLLFDIDDTLTTEGRLTAQAYDALWRAREAGLSLIAVTGRPAGWCDHIARMWPVDAVVGENGAFYFWHDAVANKLRQRFVIEEETRAALRRQADAVAENILRAVPGCALASDQAYRVADIAIDFCEDVAPLPLESIHRIRDLMLAAGMNAKISSIHVNGWFGEYDKLSTTKLLFTEKFNCSMATAHSHCVFVGDSPNDAPMFAFFANAVGVANVRDFTQLPHWPAYVTNARCGEGFAEVVEGLLRAR